MSKLGPFSSESLHSSAAASRVPSHVAVIMDGNGRWAQKRGYPRMIGHKYGAERVREIVEQAGQSGVKVLTLYAFSDENWRRPVDEVGAIMHLLEHYLRKERIELHEKNVRFRTVGDLSRLSPSLRQLIDETKTMLAGNTGLTLNVAISYSGRAELVRAVRHIADKVAMGEINPEHIDQELISQHLDTAGLPDPDLVIRTSGELRVSNFLLWQSAYTEFYFTGTMWPDFDRVEFVKALSAYVQRDRRFGRAVDSAAEAQISASLDGATLGVNPC